MKSIARACREAGIGPLSRTIIYLTEADDPSHSDIRDALNDAIRAELSLDEPGYYAWVFEVWDDEFVFEYETPDGTSLYSRPYTVNDDGSVTIGGGQREVERVVTYKPVSAEAVESVSGDGPAGEEIPLVEAAREGAFAPQIIPLMEKSVRPDGTIPIKIIEPGWGSSCYYPADVLERDGPGVFTRGTQMFWDHMTEQEMTEQPEGELNNLASVLETDARWEPDNPNGPGLYADAKVFGPYDEKLDDLGPHIGTSINTTGLAESGEAEGREGMVLTELRKNPFTSVDYVTKPGAGGAVLQLFESLRPSKAGGRQMPEELKEAQDKLDTAERELAESKEREAELKAELEAREAKDRSIKATELATESLKDIDLPEAAKTKVIEKIAADPPVTEDGKLDESAIPDRTREAAEAEAAYLESVAPNSGEVNGMGESVSGDDDGKTKLRETIKRRHPDWSDEQVDIAVNGR